MESVFNNISSFVGNLTQILMKVLCLGIVVQITFAEAAFGWDIIGNVMEIVAQLGDSGFVGLIALIILWGLFDKK